MVTRRDVLKGAAASTILVGTAASQEAEPVDSGLATFDKKKQFELPGWAFDAPLFFPPVPRPTAVGSYEELIGKPVFGADDPVPIGNSFHGIASEFGTTPQLWQRYGCNPKLNGTKAWKDKQQNFGTIQSKVAGNDIANWGGLPMKCYKIAVLEVLKKLRPDARFKARVYAYAGMSPGPTLKMRIGQPVIYRYVNHLDNELSVHLHGGHSPSHSDGFPTFYVLQGKSRDYFYPNIVPLRQLEQKESDGASFVKDDGSPAYVYEPDIDEAQSTMWYHDHGMDLTGYNVSKGLAGMAPCFGEPELQLIRDGVLPGLGEASCLDPEMNAVSSDSDLEHPDFPGFYRREKEPYYNPYDIPLVLQDKVIDLKTGQIAFDSAGHNGYLGDTMFVNGVAWPHLVVENRKYRLRLLNGSNARVYRLRILRAVDFARLSEDGIDDVGTGEDDPAVIEKRPGRYGELAQDYLRIGKDSWLWSAASKRSAIVLAMANRADLVVDFASLVGRDLEPGEEEEFVLVNTMPQADGRGPKQKLDDGGDPRVLPLPFDVIEGGKELNIAESRRPIALMKFVVRGARPKQDATVEDGTPLIPHRPIQDHEVSVVREFIFERGKGAWQINGRFYDPDIANATPNSDCVEEWVLRNGGGGWWHPIHIHLESHQLVRYEKDFAADDLVDLNDPPAASRLLDRTDVTKQIEETELMGLHDTQVLGPNTVARIRMRFRTWEGPFVFHCHNLEHEDMRMMFNFEPVADGRPPSAHDPNIAPDGRTHGINLTLDERMGELPQQLPPAPKANAGDVGTPLIPNRKP